MLPTVNPSVVFRSLSEGAVLFSAKDEVYFGLNAVGARVWELLKSHASLDSLCAAVAAEYPDAPPQTIRDDVSELLEELTEHGLVHPRQTETPTVEPGARHHAQAGGASSGRAR
jgi:hypothetical protein